jgi:hypothetical protein
MQKRSNAKFGIDPRYLHYITGREYWRVFHTEMINVNRHRKKRERQPTNFDLLSSLSLKIRDHSRAVAVYVNESAYDEGKREQKYRDAPD